MSQEAGGKASTAPAPPRRAMASPTDVPPPPEPVGERPSKRRRVVCPDCGKELRADHLAEHKREKPYACDFEGRGAAF
eukprot:5435018-Alexandrium_andersonii.AAC.1